MPTNDSASMATLDALTALALEIDAALHGGRAELVAEFARHFNWSITKVYRQLKKVGWTSGRKTRADKGTTSQCEQALTQLCAAQRIGVRKNGKVPMEVPNARSLLQANGRSFTVSNSTLCKLLKDRNMDIKAQKQDRAYQPLRSLHPNHVHLVDPSLCLIYYDPAGKQHVIREDVFYKNKPENFNRIEKWKVWRYVLVDHYSNTFVVYYYRSKGETQANLYDFLLYAWKRLEGRAIHGVPKILYWDKGSANTAKAIKCALKALGVEAIEHTAGNPRAKGAVEQGNNQVENLFESRLKYEPVRNVDELNSAVEGWTNAYNSNSIPHYDSRLKRRYMAEPVARYALWQIIRKEQLRLLPDEDVCRYLLSAEPVERQVRADLTVSFKHPNTKRREYYDVSQLPNIYPKAIVQVSPLIYGNNQALVTVDDYKGEESTHILDAIERDAFSGFRTDAAIMGEEWKSQPDTAVERAGKAADRAEFPGKDQDEIKKAKDKNAAPFNGELDAHSHLKHVQQPAFMARPGSEMSVPNRLHVDVRVMSVTETCKRLLTSLGRRDDVNYYEQVSGLYPEGVPEDEFETLLQRISSPTDQQEKPTISLVK